MKRVFIYREADEAHELVLQRRGAALEIRFDGSTERVESVRLPDGRRSLIGEDGRQFAGHARALDGDAVELSTPVAQRKIRLADPLRDRIAQAVRGSGAELREEEIRALMPGRVVDVAVGTGENVQPGTLLLVVEAMKMQNEIRAERAAVVERVEVEAGQAIETGALMVTLKAANS